MPVAGVSYLVYLQHASDWSTTAGVQNYGQKCGLRMTLRQDFRAGRTIS